MKHLTKSLFAVATSAVVMLSACGPTEAERKAQAEAEQARIDSIAQAKADSIAELKAAEIARQQAEAEANSFESLKKRCYEAGYKMGWGMNYRINRSDVKGLWSGYCRNQPIEVLENDELFEEYYRGFCEARDKSYN